MKPREITKEEREELRCSGKEYCLYFEWEECVIRLGGPEGRFIKFKGEEEFRPHPDSNVFYEATLMGELITREEYDKY